MEVIFLSRADEDLIYWTDTGNKSVLKKIAKLTEAILEHPFEGIDKPEALAQPERKVVSKNYGRTPICL